MKIEILVAVDSNGNWSADGSGTDGKDDDHVDHFDTLHDWANHCAVGAVRYLKVETYISGPEPLYVAPSSATEVEPDRAKVRSA